MLAKEIEDFLNNNNGMKQFSSLKPYHCHYLMKRRLH